MPPEEEDELVPVWWAHTSDEVGEIMELLLDIGIPAELEVDEAHGPMRTDFRYEIVVPSSYSESAVALIGHRNAQLAPAEGELSDAEIHDAFEEIAAEERARAERGEDPTRSAPTNRALGAILWIVVAGLAAYAWLGCTR